MASSANRRSLTGLVAHHIDSVLKRLAPTFDRDTPCDIVDVYPQGQLWSSKIHDFFKPRTHLLIEPRQRYYRAWLNSLVKRPNSTFKHLPWDPCARDTLSRLFDDDVLPKGTRGGPDQFNRSILIFLNIARLRQTTTRKSQFLLHYFEALLNNDSIHRYGMVRLIVVATAKHADILVPRTLNRRKRVALLAEATSKVVHVAGINPPKLNWELKGLETVEKSASRTDQREKEAGIAVPEHRVPKPLELAPSPTYVKKWPGEKVYTYTQRPKKSWHDEYIDLERKLRYGTLGEKAKQKRLADRRRRLLLENRDAAHLDELAATRKSVDKLEEKLREMKQTANYSTDQVRQVLSEMQQLSPKRDAQYESLSWLLKLYATHQAEERRCFEDNGEGKQLPLLQWDRRPYEPLHVNPSEFSRDTECSVVDIQPDPNSPILSRRRQYLEAGNESDYHAIVQVFLYLGRLLIYSGRKPLDTILQALFPGRPMPELIDSIPSLTQLAKVSVSFIPSSEQGEGAKTDQEEKAVLEYADDCLSHVSWRTLPASTIWDIAAEWHSWPFKPVAVTDLHKILGGGSIDSHLTTDDGSP